MLAKLRLRLLGSPQVWQENKVVQGFRTTKTKALFFYLAVTQCSHTRSALATLLWGDMPERNAHVSLSKSLSNLRDLFPTYLEIDRHSVAFNPGSSSWLDVAAFEAGCVAAHSSAQLGSLDTASLGQLRQTMDLYQGDFLAGFSVNNASDYDAWQSTERQRLRDLAVQGFDTLTKRYAALGNWAGAIACCRQILALEPWREETHRQLMRLLVASGQRSAALVQYEICYRILQDELAVAPDSETVALYDAIVAGAFDESSSEWKPQGPAVEPPGTHGDPAHLLPQRPPSLIGREDELSTLQQRLHDPAYRLISLLGPGGVGKTTLALACVEALRPHFRDGVWYVSLAGTDDRTAGDPPEMAEAKLNALIAETLGIAFSGPRSPEVEIADFLFNKHLLLVLDNFDPFVGVAPLVSRLLAKAAGVQILVTSRQALQLPEESLFPVSPMPVPDVGVALPGKPEDSLSYLMSFASVALLVQCAQRVRVDFRLTAENARAVAQICRYVDGLPLGIELAATWLNTLAPDEIAEELARGLDLLDAPPLQLTPQQTGIRAVFEYSWQLLSLQERLCAAQFAVFQGGASREAALWVTQAALPQLSALITKSMVRRNAQGRYEMHELLRQFCAEKLDKEYASGAAYSRHSSYYLTLVQEREKAIKRKDAKRTIQESRLELGNIRQAWRWAVEQGNVAMLQRALVGYVRLYILVGLYEEASATLEWTESELRTRVANLSNSQEARRLFCELCSGLLSHAAGFLNKQALFDRAIILAQAAQRMVQDAELPVSSAHALLRWSEAYWYQGHIVDAGPLLEQVLELTRRASLLDVEPQEHYADALCIQGSIAVRMGKYREAITCYETSLHIGRALQDAYRESRAIHSLGTTFRNQGRFGEARSYLEQGLYLSRQIGDLHSESRSLNSLGDIAYYLGDFMEAQRHFSQVRDIAVQVGDRRSQSIAVTNLGIIARDLGAFRQAKELLAQGLHLAAAIGFRRGEAWALVCRSLLLHQEHQDQAALDAGQQGLRLFAELSDDVGQAYARTEIGHALAGLLRWDEAEAAYRQALSMRRTLSQPHLEMEVLAGLIRINLAQHEPIEAKRKAQSLYTYLKANRPLGVEEPIRVYWTCYQAFAEDDRAPEILRDAHRMLEERSTAIDDEELRSSYLQNIAVHRLVREAWAVDRRKRVH